MAEQERQTLELAGKVALVTGAGRGLRRSCGQLLAKRGASVAVGDLDPLRPPRGDWYTRRVSREPACRFCQRHKLPDRWRPSPVGELGVKWTDLTGVEE